jgi:hypothetical protein
MTTASQFKPYLMRLCKPTGGECHCTGLAGPRMVFEDKVLFVHPPIWSTLPRNLFLQRSLQQR